VSFVCMSEGRGRSSRPGRTDHVRHRPDAFFSSDLFAATPGDHEAAAEERAGVDAPAVARCTVGQPQQVPSPCVQVCRLDGSGEVCTGCDRTLDEIRRWSRMCDAEKRAVNARVIRWRPRPFWGESAVENGEGVRGDISSFEVLDHLLDLYAGSHVLPALEEVVVWGFSAGGQMINGYTAASEVHAVLERRGLRVRYVIMSPSNFLHFSSDRVLPGTVDAGEMCDQAGDNGDPGSCCTSSCEYRGRDEVCRGAAGVCDMAETCSGSSGTCPGDMLATGTVCRPAVPGGCDGPVGRRSVLLPAVARRSGRR